MENLTRNPINKKKRKTQDLSLFTEKSELLQNEELT